MRGGSGEGGPRSRRIWQYRLRNAKSAATRVVFSRRVSNGGRRVPDGRNRAARAVDLTRIERDGRDLPATAHESSLANRGLAAPCLERRGRLADRADRPADRALPTVKSADATRIVTDAS